MRPQILHNLYVVSVNAEAASQSIRSEWSSWQPSLQLGFQGRLLFVIRETELVFEGRPSGCRLLALEAAGNDRHVREQLKDSLRRLVLAGRLLQPDATTPMTAKNYDELVDQSLINAMPASYLMGHDVTLVFDVPWTSALHADARARLEAYQANFLAPQLKTFSEPATWSINLSGTSIEQLYILLDVYQSPHPLLAIRSAREPNGVGMNYLVESFKAWRSSSPMQFPSAAAA